MTEDQRCDEIIRMIDEVLEAALSAERGFTPSRQHRGPSFHRPFALTQRESR